MNKPDHAPRWYQPWRRPDGAAASDPADLGTCFGMEVMLAAEPAPAKSTAPARPTGWMRRLVSRRRPSL